MDDRHRVDVRWSWRSSWIFIRATRKEADRISKTFTFEERSLALAAGREPQTELGTEEGGEQETKQRRKWMGNEN